MSEGKFRLTFVKGGAGSGYHGHRGRPGKRGGSVSGGGAGAPAPDISDERRQFRPGIESTPGGRNAWRGILYTMREAKATGLVDHTAVVQSAGGSYTLDKAMAEYDDKDTGFFTVNVGQTSTGKPKVRRLMGYFPNKIGIPQPGDKMFIQHDSYSGKQTLYRAEVVADTGKSVPLWHYD